MYEFLFICQEMSYTNPAHFNESRASAYVMTKWDPTTPAPCRSADDRRGVKKGSLLSTSGPIGGIERREVKLGYCTKMDGRSIIICAKYIAIIRPLC